MDGIIQPNELIDLDGLRQNIREAKADFSDFVNNARSLSQTLLRSTESVTAELQQIRQQVSNAPRNDMFGQMAGRASDLITQLGGQRAATAGLLTTEKQYEGIVNSLTERLNKLIVEYEQLDTTKAKTQQRAKQLAREMSAISTELSRVGKAAKQAGTGAAEVTGQYNRLQKELTEARKQLKALDNAFDANTGQINKNNAEAVRLGNIIQRNDGLLKKFDATMGVYNRNVGNYASGTAGLVGGLTRMAIGYVTLDAVFREGKAMVDATKQAESFAAAMEAVHVSQEQAARSQRFVYEQADKLGTEVSAVSDAFITLAGATRGSNLEGEQTRRIYNSIITAGVGLRRNNEQIQRAVTAVGQVFSKQKVQAEELSGQLAEALPGSLQILAKQMNMSVRQMLDMAQKGDLLALEVLPKLADGLLQTYSDKVVENADNLAANTNRFTNAVQELRRTVFEETGLKNAFAEFLSITTSKIKEGVFWLRIYKEGWNSFFGTAAKPKDPLAVRQPSSRLLDSFRQLSTPEMAEAIRLQEQAQQTKEQKLYVDNLKKIYAERLKQEKDLQAEIEKQKYELGKQERDKRAKKEAADAKRRQAQEKREAEQRLNEALATEREKTSQRLSNLDRDGAATNANPAVFAAERLRIEQEGIAARQKLLIAVGKRNTAEYERTLSDQADAEAAYAKARAKIEIETWDRSLETVKEGLKKIEEEYEFGLTEQITQLDEWLEEQQTKIETAQKRGLISEQEAARRLFAVREDYLQAVAAATVAAANNQKSRGAALIDALLNQAKTQEQIDELTDLKRQLLSDKESDRVKALAALRKRLAKETGDYEISEEERTAKRRQEINKAIMDLLQQGVSSFFEISSAFRQQEISQLEKQKEHELSLVEGNDDAKKLIEQRFAARQKELRRRQAVADKAAAIFQIGINTAIAASQALLTSGGVLVPFIIALGALQAATVAAKPIPEFFKGKKDSYEGLGWVADRGPEIVRRYDERTGQSTTEYLTTKTLTYLHKHDRVYTAHETQKMLAVENGYAGELSRGGTATATLTPDDVYRAVSRANAERPVVEEHRDERGYQRFIRRQNSRIRDLNDYFRLPRQ